MNLLAKVILVIFFCSTLSFVGYVGLSDDTCEQDCDLSTDTEQHEVVINPQGQVANFDAESPQDGGPEPNAEFVDAPTTLDSPLAVDKQRSGFGSLWAKIKESIKFTSENDSGTSDSVVDPYKTISDNEVEVAEGGIEGTGITDDPFNLNQGGDEDGIEGTGLSTDEDAQVVAIGPITQFGSIYVNGIKYETDQAEVVFTDSSANDELLAGMIVAVYAQWDQDQQSYNAYRVLFDRQIQGPVSGVSFSDDQVLVSILGVSVLVDEDTVLNGIELQNIKKGQVLEVSGLLDDQGEVIATYIGLQAMRSESLSSVEVEGRIRRVKNNAMRLELGSTTVDASQAQFSEGDINDLSKNDWVEIIGAYDERQKLIYASKIKLKNSSESLSKGTSLSIDAVITDFESLAKFKLNGFTSDASNASITGDTALGSGVRVKANGYINDEGIFDLRTARIITRARYTIKAQVDSIIPSLDQLTVLNVTAAANEDTLYASKTDFPNKYQSLYSISEGDWVQLKGNYYQGRLHLNSITMLDPQKKQMVKGFISEAGDGAKEIMGLPLEAKTSSVAAQLLEVEDGQFVSARGNLKENGRFVVEKLGVKVKN